MTNEMEKEPSPKRALKYADIMVGSEVELTMYRRQIKSLQKEFVKNKTLFKKSQQTIVMIEKKQDEELNKMDGDEMSMKKLMSAIKAEDAKIAQQVDQFKRLDSHLNQKLTEESKEVEDLQKELENLRSGNWEDLEDWHSYDPDLELNQSTVRGRISRKNEITQSSTVMKDSISSRRSRHSREQNSHDSNFGFIFSGQNARLQRSSQSRGKKEKSQNKSRQEKMRRTKKYQLTDSQDSLNFAIQRESQMGNRTLDEIANISCEHQMLPDELSPRTPARQMRSKRRY